MKRLADVDWDNWQAEIPATLVFVINDGKILLIDKKTGIGKGKVNGPGGSWKTASPPSSARGGKSMKSWASRSPTWSIAASSASSSPTV